MGNAIITEHNVHTAPKAVALDIKCEVSPKAERFAVRLGAHAVTVIRQTASAEFGSRSDLRVGMVENVLKKYICMCLDRGCTELYVRLPELAADEELSKCIGAAINRINALFVAVQNIDVTYILPEKHTETYSYANDIESETDILRYSCKCTRCGRYFDLWDAQENFSFDSGVIGYGSAYDDCRIRVNLCCECFDEVMPSLIKDCVTNPVEDTDDW